MNLNIKKKKYPHSQLNPKIHSVSLTLHQLDPMPHIFKPNTVLIRS